MHTESSLSGEIGRSQFVLGLMIVASLSMTHLGTLSQITYAQDRKPAGTVFRRIEPNLYSPQLYAEKLIMRFALVDLPGAKDVGSTWEVSYRMYFISEDEYEQVSANLLKQRAPEGGSLSWNPDPVQFPKKMILGEGQFKKNDLGSFEDRTFVRDNVVFKSMIPEYDQTKFGYLMTSYSVKIFDAHLKISLYRSSIFLTRVFDDDPKRPNQPIARSELYVNFYVTPKGELFTSQAPRSSGDTRW